MELRPRTRRPRRPISRRRRTRESRAARPNRATPPVTPPATPPMLGARTMLSTRRTKLLRSLARLRNPKPASLPPDRTRPNHRPIQNDRSGQVRSKATGIRLATAPNRPNRRNLQQIRARRPRTRHQRWRREWRQEKRRRRRRRPGTHSGLAIRLGQHDRRVPNCIPRRRQRAAAGCPWCQAPSVSP